MHSLNITLRNRISKNGVFIFPVFYILWAYLFWFPIFFSKESIWSFPKILFFFIGGSSPLLAGVILALVKDGLKGLISIGNRLINTKNISLKWMGIILSFWIIFDLVIAGIGFFIGITEQPIRIHTDTVLKPQNLAFMFVLSFIFPTIEEIGLRGYWIDELQNRLNPFFAALINGIFWAIWHTPFVWFPGYYINTSFYPELWWWLPSIVLHTVLIVWIYNKTNRSILAAVLFHGIMNFTGEFLGIDSILFPYMLIGYIFITTFIVIGTPNMRPWFKKNNRF
ncbi:CPBP family intramembrane glutamic endopeptidase [Gracilinema caldarium]|uniref:Abortive infection protein n=1 Tax=Gracilinema caldarium (strain ATCC 51460 / DSM 7334 / H1) TaxID=744872 RepID=F8EZB7_GRAC1|nr:type II CAAX endopeptidase family protein [Gracilinema caldarium]AEJ19709.1 Abortive infection protein [Gracilinema caldarium DSM 7334]